MIERRLVEEFHRAYYSAGVQFGTYWRGEKIVKAPTDMWAYQDIITRCRPDVIVECGTAWGGSAFFFADLFELFGHGEVITVDIGRLGTVNHDRITYLTGDSVAMAAQVAQLVGERSCMVVLDSDHRTAHVAAELEAYGPLVTSGQYLVVEDTNLGWLADMSFDGNGPREALVPWLVKHPEFVVDEEPERYGLTMNPGGWLRRV
jgi:cephalosporin hydroxylase